MASIEKQILEKISSVEGKGIDPAYIVISRDFYTELAHSQASMAGDESMDGPFTSFRGFPLVVIKVKSFIEVVGKPGLAEIL
jgi:hypothetical protein